MLLLGIEMFKKGALNLSQLTYPRANRTQRAWRVREIFSRMHTIQNSRSGDQTPEILDMADLHHQAIHLPAGDPLQGSCFSRHGGICSLGMFPVPMFFK